MTDLTPARKRLVRLAFAAVAGWWLLGVALLGAGAGEIYPALAMPAFAGSGGHTRGEVGVDRMAVAFLHGHGETTVSQQALFAGIPVGHHATLAQRLAPARAEHRPARDWLRAHGLPGLAAGSEARRRGCLHPSLAPWLRTRAAVLAPGETVGAVEVRWYRETFHPPARVPTARHSTGIVRIPLAGGGGCGG